MYLIYLCHQNEASGLFSASPFCFPRVDMSFCYESMCSSSNISINSVVDISQDAIRRVIHAFNRHKFIVITLENPNPSPKAELHALSHFFGAPCLHERSDENGIVTIAPKHSESSYLSASTMEHRLHTDGSFDSVPPKVSAILCVHPSTCGGGETLLLQAKDVYQNILAYQTAILPMLYQSDAMKITRKERQAVHPIFREENGRIQIIYRCDSSSKIEVAHYAKDAFKSLSSMIKQIPPYRFTLQKNQLLVMDNTAVLHGRTSFALTGERLLYRLNMNGISPYRHQLTFGFLK